MPMRMHRLPSPRGEGAFLLDHGDLRVARAAQDVDRHVAAVALEPQVHPRVAELQVEDRDSVEEGRQGRVLQADAVAVVLEFESDAGGEEAKGAAAAQAWGEHATG